jgi:inhibitor of nuclear factor kappa-B kinase subunit alpha
MKGPRVLVQKYVHQEKSPGDIFKLPRKFRISRGFFYYPINRLRKTGSIKNRLNSGRPRMVRTNKLIKTVCERIRQNPQRSQRTMGRGLKIPSRSMVRVLKQNLRLKPYKKTQISRVHNASSNGKAWRSRLLLKRHGQESVENIISSDEKKFVIEQHLNAQNDVVYAASFEDIPEHMRTVQRFRKSSSIMIRFQRFQRF